MDPSDPSLRPYDHLLLALAKDSIIYGLDHGRDLPINLSTQPKELQALRATFVTLRLGGDLRGCIGTLDAIRPLARDIVHNAFASAFMDPRFPRLEHAELAHLQIQISVLSPPIELSFHSELDLLGQLRPGIDGIILQEGSRKGTFLPSVWESLPGAEDFLAQLKIKAGLPPEYWSETIRVQRYTALSIP